MLQVLSINKKIVHCFDFFLFYLFGFDILSAVYSRIEDNVWFDGVYY